jgi:hypothetical protein
MEPKVLELKVCCMTVEAAVKTAFTASPVPRLASDLARYRRNPCATRYSTIRKTPCMQHLAFGFRAMCGIKRRVPVPLFTTAALSNAAVKSAAAQRRGSRRFKLPRLAPITST